MVQEQDSFKIIRCSKCNSEIAIDNRTIYPIDCDCGAEISKNEASVVDEGTNNKTIETMDKIRDMRSNGCVQKDKEEK